MAGADLQVTVHDGIAGVDAASWDALVQDGHPFLQHNFLLAMENHACVGPDFGWLPCHITVHVGAELIGALPLYEKTNSYGEFVFDHAWQHAYERP